MSSITREIENLYDLPFTDPKFEYSNGCTSSSEEESAGISNSDEEINNQQKFTANSEEIEKLQKKLDKFSEEIQKKAPRGARTRDIQVKSLTLCRLS
ncbi:hypothetical protein M0813_09438 [Anaeramoeba flamelloides]|uniref:Uncharacterized protein n=1 Tax=Anaeramoeba flamelloides TaxID=1746091 RepID=A0ABQ8X5S5_9EUKA|nr:hypothetical protein M0813_09438 [Anaeramoeba flamelloides]